MENRNGLVAAAEATLATGTAEREAAERLSGRLPKGTTLGARACVQLRRMAAQARWTAARKILASLS